MGHQLPDFEHEEESSRPDVQSSSEGRHNPFTFQPSSKGRHSSSALQPSSETRRYSSSTHQPTNSTRQRKNDNKIHPAIETTPERNPTPKRKRQNHSSEQNYEKSHPATESFSKKTKNH